jgi:two-component system phosphate regulon sensor histidine kinase PhoR
LKDGFITNVSHELRTPLTAIKAYLELLQMTQQGNLDKKQLEFVHSIERSANKLLHHINQIIDISEVQSGTLTLHKKVINLSELVEEGTESWRERLAEKGLSLQVNLPQEQLWVTADPTRLSWAIDNLMDNACKYTLTGEVDVTLQQRQDEAHLDITDTGVGIDVADQPYLFTRFFRAVINQSMFDVAGVGLGLYLTRSLIEGHGGRVWFKSKPGTGSTFSLAIPVLSQMERDENGFVLA